jgi:hypothetical protein
MTATLLPLLIALVAFFALGGKGHLFGADTTPTVDDASDWT